MTLRPGIVGFDRHGLFRLRNRLSNSTAKMGQRNPSRVHPRSAGSPQHIGRAMSFATTHAALSLIPPLLSPDLDPRQSVWKVYGRWGYGPVADDMAHLLLDVRDTCSVGVGRAAEAAKGIGDESRHLATGGVHARACEPGRLLRVCLRLRVI